MVPYSFGIPFVACIVEAGETRWCRTMIASAAPEDWNCLQTFRWGWGRQRLRVHHPLAVLCARATRTNSFCIVLNQSFAAFTVWRASSPIQHSLTFFGCVIWF